ncbi:MAG TPA: hypothetical protein VM223_00915, partial [Planctomycetota bacterium]|nr:hypothetical protein [Planctomycetota bacterium]
QAQNGLDAVEGRRTGLQNAVSQATKDLAEKQAQLQKLNDDLAAAMQAVGQRNAERPQIEAAIRRLQDEEANLITRTNDLKAGIAVLDEQRAAAKAQVDAQNAKLVEAGALLDELTKRQEAASQKAQESGEAVARSEGKKAEMERSVAETRQRLDELIKQEKQLDASTSAVKETSAELDAAVSALEKKKTKLSADVQSATDAVTDLEKQKVLLGGEIQRLEADKGSRTKELLRLEQELETKRVSTEAGTISPAKDNGKADKAVGSATEPKE